MNTITEPMISQLTSEIALMSSMLDVLNNHKSFLQESVLQENKKMFSSVVEPLIAAEKYLRDIKQRQSEQSVLTDFAFCHAVEYPGNFDVFLRGKHIMNIHMDHQHIKHGFGTIMRCYDDEWLNLDSFIQFIIRHYINGEPLPNHDLDY
jgi:hypothetical protein